MLQPRKLLLYSPQFLPSVGGLQLTVHHWAEALAAMGHEVLVCTNTAGNNGDNGSYAVARQTNWLQLWQLCRKADLVIMFNISLKAILPWWLSGTPMVVSHHTLLPQSGLPAALSRLKTLVANKLAKSQFACSHFVAANYRGSDTIYSPYRETLMTWKPPDERRRGSLLFIGRLVSDKGLDLLLEAFGVLEKDEHQHWSLTICGDGPLKPMVADWVRARPKGNAVRLLPFVDQQAAASLYQEHAITVVPSEVEPFGMVVLEALASGCRVVAAATGGLPEAGGTLATYFHERKAETLAAAIRSANEMPYPAAGPLQEHLADKTIAATAMALNRMLQRILNSTHG